MAVWQWVQRLLKLRPDIREIRYAPNFPESSIQFGDRVRILSDRATEECGLAGKVGEVYGQTTPSSTNPTIIGTPLKDYAVSVFFEDTREQHWFPEHLVELIDHNPGAIMRLGDKEYVRNADGSWVERKRVAGD
jgi:hypothetical protein